MGEMHLYAISIDEFRDLFAGNPDLAHDLRELAAAAFTPRRAHRPAGLLDRLGPLLKQPMDAPVIRPGVPTGHDLDDVVHGRDIAPARLSAAWKLIRLWLDANSFDRLTLPLDGSRVEAIDFELGRVGVPAHLCVASLFRRKLSVPPKFLPGHAGGYCRDSHAVALHEAWAGVLEQLDAEASDFITPLVGWLDKMPEWEQNAHEAGRISPDLVALYVP